MSVDLMYKFVVKPLTYGQPLGLVGYQLLCNFFIDIPLISTQFIVTHFVMSYLFVVLYVKLF